MIEDFLDDPKAELRWFGWALLLLASLTFGANLVYFSLEAAQQPDLLKNNLVVVAGAIVGYATQYTGSAIGNPLFGLLALIALFIARNFLSAFRHYRPHLMAILGIVPLYYIGLAEIGAPAAEVIALTITAAVWTLLLPIPRSEERMTQATRGLAVGLISSAAFQLGGVVVAAAYAGWMLYRRRLIEAAVTGIAGALPALVYISAALAVDRADTSAVLYGIMLAVVLVEGFIGLLVDSFAPAELEAEGPREESDDEAADEPADRTTDEPDRPASDADRRNRWG